MSKLIDKFLNAKVPKWLENNPELFLIFVLGTISLTGIVFILFLIKWIIF